MSRTMPVLRRCRSMLNIPGSETPSSCTLRLGRRPKGAASRLGRVPDHHAAADVEQLLLTGPRLHPSELATMRMPGMYA